MLLIIALVIGWWYYNQGPKCDRCTRTLVAGLCPYCSLSKHKRPKIKAEHL